jgi:hypothetical protein
VKRKVFTPSLTYETITIVNEELTRAAARQDLLISETSALSARHQVTKRAEIFLASRTLALDDVLDVLKISRATWYRRLEALKVWEAGPQTPDPGETP